MDDFTLGSVLSGIVASTIFAGTTYFFVKKKTSDKQENKIDDTEVFGDIEQIIDTDSATGNTEQHLEVKKSRIDGGISQKITKKKV